MAPDRLVIGIDLGTTNSCVGVWLNGRVEIVPSDQGGRTTPSCVAFTDSERLIGEGANHQVATNASNTIFDVKRLIGRSYSDASVKSDAKYWPFGVIEGHGDKPLIRVSYLGMENGFSPEEISAMVLVKMKETAEAFTRRPIKDAVITVPAYFNSSQRQATKDAGIIAGLNVLHIINEPTAAAITYSINRKKGMDSTVLVYDLGGGTLDVSLVHVFSNGWGLQLQVKATAGDNHLGGDDFTNNMVDHFVNEFKRNNPHISGDISGDKKAIGRLRRSCDEEKKRLSTNPIITVEIDALFQGIDFYSTLTRDKFEQLNNDLFRRCKEPIKKCLLDANMDNHKVDDIVLVGGSTRIPQVHQLLKDFFKGKELCRNINADEAIAYGATIQAASLMGVSTGIQTSLCKLPKVLDITPFSLGIGILEGLILEVIERYTTIPATKETTFVRDKANQSSVDIAVYEDERAMANKFCIPLDHNNKMRFHVDQDGILHVSAHNREGLITYTNLVIGFSTSEIEKMKQNTHYYKTQDEQHKKNVQARNDIQNLLFTISNNMNSITVIAERLLQVTREQEKKNPVYPAEGNSRNPSSSSGRDSRHHRGKKDKMKMSTKKLLDRIRKLQELADGTTEWLENNELTISEIIDRKKQIEDEYHSITSEIDKIKQKIEGDGCSNKSKKSNSNCFPST